MNHIRPHPPRALRTALTALLLVWVSSSSRPAVAQPGAMDPSFVHEPGADNYVGCLLGLPEGGLMVGGGFNRINGASIAHLARLTADGIVDSTFTAAGIRDYLVNRVVRQPDGRLIVFAGNSVLRRLWPDGSADASFQSQVEPASTVYTIALQPDGKLLVATDQAILRLTSTGSFDPEFTPFPASQWVTNGTTQTSIRYQFKDVVPVADGKILVAGWLAVGDTDAPTGGWLRLNPGGTLDPLFQPPKTNVDAIAVDTTGRIVVAEPGGLVDAQGFTRINRYLADGSPDPAFKPTLVEGWTVVSRIAFLADARIAVGGTFRRASGLARAGLALLGPDGGLDADFDGRDDITTVRDLLPTTDGRLVVAGELKNPAGWPYLYYARLLTSPAGPGRFEWATGGVIAREDAGDLTLTVCRRGGSQGAASVHFETLDSWGQTVPGKDYVPASGTLTFPPGETNQTVHLTLLDDAVIEPTKVLRLQLTNPTDGAALGSQKELEVTILDDDAAVAFAQPEFTTVESESGAVIRVVRTGFLERQVTVEYLTRDQTATAGQDYQAVTGTLTFAPGETNRSFTVPILMDALAEPTESVGLVLTNPGPHLILGPTDQATLRILDDAPGAVDPTFRVADLHQVFRMALDGEGRPVVADEPMYYPPLLPLQRLDLTGHRDPTFAPQLLPAYVRALEMQADGRLLLARDPLGWPAPDPDMCSLFRLNADGNPDPNFTGCSAAPHYTIALAFQADGRIIAAGFNGNPGTTSLTPAFVRLESDGTLDPGFRPASDGFVNALALQPDGRILVSASRTTDFSSSELVLSRLNPDGSVDPSFAPPAGVFADWQYALALAVQPDGRILVGGAAGPRTDLQGRLVRLEPEGRLDATFQAARPAVDFALAVQAGGKILVGSTNHVYRLHPDGSLDPTFGESGDPEGLVTDGWVECIRLAADGRVWASGSFTTFNGMDRPTVVRLQNDAASAAGALRWTTDHTTAPEPTGKARLWVTRVGGRHGEIVVNYATHGGTAEPGQRYSPQAGALRFADGETGPKLVEVPITDDQLGVGDQTFRVSLANALGGAVLGSPAEMTVTIVEDDTSLHFDQAAYSAHESAGSLDLGITRRGILSGTTTVTCEAVPGSAHEGEDYRSQPVELTFAPGQTHAVFHLQLIDNAWAQPDRRFSVILTQCVGANLETPGVPVTILDDDWPGALDPGFDPIRAGWPTNQWFDVNALLPQADGSVIAAGYSPQDVGGTGGLLRYKADGTPDAEFGLALTNTPPVSLPTAQCCASLPGGGFILGLAGGGMARADATGVVVAPFAPVVQGSVKALLTLPDGRYVLGGELYRTNLDGVCSVLMLKPDETIDESFAAVTAESDWSPVWGWLVEINALERAPDGGIIVGGRFDRLAGQPRTNLAKLRSEGTLDAEFKVEVSNATGPDTALAGKVTQIRTQPDGRILIAGQFRRVQGVERHQLARLNADGSLDRSFDAGLSFSATPDLVAQVGGLALQPDGRILIGCAWQPAAWPPGGPGRALVTRLEPDGTGDPFFRAAEPASAWGVSVTSLALGPNDAIWLGGAFATVNGEPRPGVARLRGVDVLHVGGMQVAPGGALTLTVMVPQTGFYGLESSPDLVSWQLIGARDLPAGTAEWSVPHTTTAPPTFYRLVVNPASPGIR